MPQRPSRMKFAGFCKVYFVGLNAERGEPPRGPICKHDPDKFLAARRIVIKPGLHDDFFHRGCKAFRTIRKDVEQGGGAVIGRSIGRKDARCR